MRSTRVGREAAPEAGALEVDPPQVLRHRMRATHLDRRLPAGRHPDAAYGGLQDSTPRDALLALHARLDGVGPSGWEDPSLAQIWFRWSDYVVPRDALGPFTLGTLPRDPETSEALQQLADVALGLLDGGPMTSRRLMETLPHLPDPHLVRMLSTTGKIHIRWDASRIEVLPARPADVDEEEARVELARRFVHWLGPARPAQFARWAGLVADDAEATWRALAAAHDLVAVSVGGRARWLLAEDEPALRDDEPLEGVRLLPPGDPVLYLDRDLVVPPVPDHLADRQPDGDVTQRLLNSLWGRIVVDGAMVASWGRSAGNVTIAPWHELSPHDVDRIEAEATSLTTALARPVRLRWLD